MSGKTDGRSVGRYEIGRITGAHGVRGDMLLAPLTDYPERFYGMERLDISAGGKPSRSYKVVRLEPYEGKNVFFLHLEGVDDRNAAEAMRGASVTVKAEERVELSEDEYWLDDIIGLSVLSAADGGNLGVITDVMHTGSNDVYIVKTPEGKTKAIPAIADVVKTVDVEAGTMTAVIPEGLWD